MQVASKLHVAQRRAQKLKGRGSGAALEQLRELPSQVLRVEHANKALTSGLTRIEDC